MSHPWRKIFVLMKGTMERTAGKLTVAVADFSLAIKAVPDHLGALEKVTRKGTLHPPSLR